MPHELRLSPLAPGEEGSAAREDRIRRILANRPFLCQLIKLLKVALPYRYATLVCHTDMPHRYAVCLSVAPIR